MTHPASVLYILSILTLMLAAAGAIPIVLGVEMFLVEGGMLAAILRGRRD